MAKRFGYSWKLVPAAVLLCCFSAIALLLRSNAAAAYDSFVYADFSAAFLPDWLPAMKCFTFLGSVWTLVPLAAAMLTAGIAKKEFRLFGFASTGNLLFSWLSNESLKAAFRRQRPDISRWFVQETGYSFPSGHSMNSAAFYGYLALMCLCVLKRPQRKIAALLLIFLAVMIGTSRVCLGVHYPSDVTAGWCAGFADALVFSCLTDGYLAQPSRENLLRGASRL